MQLDYRQFLTKVDKFVGKIVKYDFITFSTLILSCLSMCLLVTLVVIVFIGGVIFLLFVVHRPQPESVENYIKAFYYTEDDLRDWIIKDHRVHQHRCT